MSAIAHLGFWILVADLVAVAVQIDAKISNLGFGIREQKKQKPQIVAVAVQIDAKISNLGFWILTPKASKSPNPKKATQIPNLTILRTRH